MRSAPVLKTVIRPCGSVAMNATSVDAFSTPREPVACRPQPPTSDWIERPVSAATVSHRTLLRQAVSA